MRKTLLSTIVAGSIAVRRRTLSAEEMKPVAIVSIASYQTLQADLKFVGELADTPGLDAMADGLVPALQAAGTHQGLDKTEPFGAVVVLDGQNPRVRVPANQPI